MMRSPDVPAKQCCAAMCSDVTAAWGAASDQQTPYSGAAPPQPHLTRQQAGCLAGPPPVLTQHPQCIALLNTQTIPAGTSSSSITNRISTRSPCVGGPVPGHQHAAHVLGTSTQNIMRQRIPASCSTCRLRFMGIMLRLPSKTSTTIRGVQRLRPLSKLQQDTAWVFKSDKPCT
jgi:hypothetical protein